MTACMTIAPDAKLFYGLPQTPRQPALAVGRTVPTILPPIPMKNSTTATLKSRRNCSRNVALPGSFAPSSPSRKLSQGRPFGPESIPSNAGGSCTRAWISPETAGKVVASARQKVVYSGTCRALWPDPSTSMPERRHLRYAHLDKLESGRPEGQARPVVYRQSRQDGRVTGGLTCCTLKCRRLRDKQLDQSMQFLTRTPVGIKHRNQTAQTQRQPLIHLPGAAPMKGRLFISEH